MTKLTATMHDETEEIRRKMVDEINSNAAERKALEEQYGQVWDTEQLQKDFEVVGFLAPFVVVIRHSDGIKGSLQFQHSPRFYFGFEGLGE